MTFRSRTNKQRWSPKTQSTLVKEMRERDRLFCMVENWLSRHHQDLALTFDRVRQRKYDIKFYFKELTPHLDISMLGTGYVELCAHALYNNESIDEIWWTCFRELQLADGRFVCDDELTWHQEDPENRPLDTFETAQELVDNMLNILLRWMNTKLINASWLCLYGKIPDGFSWAEIKADSEYYQQLHQKYLAGEPINDTEEKLQHIYPLFVQPLLVSQRLK